MQLVLQIRFIMISLQSKQDEEEVVKDVVNLPNLTFLIQIQVFEDNLHFTYKKPMTYSTMIPTSI